MSNTAIIIPARLESTRLPRKLLMKVNGKSILEYTIEKALDVDPIIPVYVATDSIEIADVADSMGVDRIVTGSHLCGTDRVAEANSILNFDYVVNLQGDSPLIRSDDIRKLLDSMFTGVEIERPDYVEKVIPHFSTLGYATPARSISVGDSFFTREYLNHIGVYGFTKESLEYFYAARNIHNIAQDLEQTRVGPWNVVEVDKYDDYFSIDTSDDFFRFSKLMGEKQ